MTTNLHDKMLAAIDALFSASNEIEAHIAEEQLLDVRAEINKYKLAAESLSEGLRLDDWDKIGCVNHDCGKCKALAEQPAQQEPVAIHQFRKCGCSDWYDGVPDHHDGQGPYEVRTLYTTPQAQPAPVQYQRREIGEGDWEDCTKEQYEKAMALPEWDTRVITAPQAQPAREWVNLTVDELIDLEHKHLRHEALVQAIEAKLKEKNT